MRKCQEGKIKVRISSYRWTGSTLPGDPASEMGASSQPSPRPRKETCLHWGLKILILLLQVQLYSGQFTVVSPDKPIWANFGEDTELHCFLAPRTNAENMEIRWFRSNDSSLVHLYREGKDQEAEQMPKFRGRTTLVKNAIVDGNIVLRIHKVRVSDAGNYTCQFQSDKHLDAATCELYVTSEGSAPSIHIEGLGTEERRLLCRSAGWYPEPRVQWKDSAEETVSKKSEPIMTQDADGLYQVEAGFILRKNTNRTVTCSILSPVLRQEKETSVPVAGAQKIPLID
ncbi:butyrophilin subfamily 1 member A1-like isoform X2 [Ornithorhynchus anatinus]|uniref:butyrophilin subfamily 1 member A1-like isoform X2 n=1 Tax=Ornithorhynchus anatinus TaxID=9258 RepID=UPI0010A8A64A|nr:butyrophilin subfamily 1 member A1-like isoform X2 [Ornithorhynchus anatinus]